jgi:hypothetical protein
MLPSITMDGVGDTRLGAGRAVISQGQGPLDLQPHDPIRMMIDRYKSRKYLLYFNLLGTFKLNNSVLNRNSNWEVVFR